MLNPTAWDKNSKIAFNKLIQNGYKWKVMKNLSETCLAYSFIAYFFFFSFLGIFSGFFYSPLSIFYSTFICIYTKWDWKSCISYWTSLKVYDMITYADSGQFFFSRLLFEAFYRIFHQWNIVTANNRNLESDKLHK